MSAVGPYPVEVAADVGRSGLEPYYLGATTQVGSPGDAGDGWCSLALAATAGPKPAMGPTKEVL
jgi:hypothetical protein